MKEKIIVAIDSPDYSAAENLVLSLKEAEYFKIGLQSFLGFGEKIIDLINGEGKSLFLDLKFKDIPNTVSGAVRSSLKFNPKFLTIHLSGGKEMIRKAVEAAKAKRIVNIVGVTILTSLDERDLLETCIESSPESAVIKLVDLGFSEGVKFFVCSPKELSFLRSRFGKEISLITPGIRPEWASTNDQKRVFTPEMAIDEGADFLVIGRPITASSDPAEAFRRVVSEIT